MKKIILASIIALSSQFALAEIDTKSIDPEFAKIGWCFKKYAVHFNSTI